MKQAWTLHMVLHKHAHKLDLQHERGVMLIGASCRLRKAEWFQEGLKQD